MRPSPAGGASVTVVPFWRLPHHDRFAIGPPREKRRDTGAPDVVALFETMNIPYTKHTLGNGLSVLVHEDHRCPIVAVNLWYHVGSKNEQPGRTGFAHLFEHLMFEGSEHYDHGFFQPLQQAGAVAERFHQFRPDELLGGGAAGRARTRAVDGIGPDGPPAARADRGQVPQPARRRAERAAAELREPPLRHGGDGHGRCAVPAGSSLPLADDRRARTTCSRRRLDDVRAFFSRYYHPANASLALAGDIDPAAALALAEAYFGDIAPGPPVGPVRDARRGGARGAAGARRQGGAAAPVPRLALAGHVRAGRCGPGPGGRRAGRRQELAPLPATGVRAADRDRRDGRPELARARRVLPGRSRPPRPATRSPNSRRRCTRRSRDSWPSRARPPTNSSAALAQAEAQFIYRIQTVGGFGGKSDQLNAYNVFLGDPGYFGHDLRRYREAAPDVGGRRGQGRASRRAARRAQRRAARAPRPRRCPTPRRWCAHDRVDRTRLPTPGPESAFRFPEVSRRVLPNGLRVRTVEHRGVPVVTFLLLLSSGSAADPSDLPGLAALTADMLDEGSGARSALDIEDALSSHRRAVRNGSRIRRDRAVAAHAAAFRRPGARPAVRHRRAPAAGAPTTSTASAISG